MDLQLHGKVVFVAGASRGIGYGIAEAFLREGAKVALTGRSPEPLAKALAALSDTYGGDRLTSFAGDMTATADLIAALDQTEESLGPIDVVIANVGGGDMPFGFKFTDDEWDATIVENLTGSVRLMREAVNRFLARSENERAGCNLIAISSIAGVDAMGSLMAYGASKAGINHFVRNLAKAVGKHGIRANVIAPGNIIFPGGTWEIASQTRPAVNEWIKTDVALQRFGQVEEIADAVVFAASPRASFMTGETWVVDGGQVR